MLNPKFKFSYHMLLGPLRKTMGQKYAKALNRIGAYTRTVARNSIKQSKDGSPSKRGSKYPKAHGGTLKNFLFYKLESGNTNVVIGPQKLHRPKAKTKPLTVNMPGRSATHMSILTFGGRQEFKRKGGSSYRPRYAARPFMQEALRKARSQTRLRAAFREIG